MSMGCCLINENYDYVGNTSASSLNIKEIIIIIIIIIIVIVVITICNN